MDRWIIQTSKVWREYSMSYLAFPHHCYLPPFYLSISRDMEKIKQQHLCALFGCNVQMKFSTLLQTCSKIRGRLNERLESQVRRKIDSILVQFLPSFSLTYSKRCRTKFVVSITKAESSFGKQEFVWPSIFEAKKVLLLPYFWMRMHSILWPLFE